MSQEIAKGGNAPVPAAKLVIVARHAGPDADFSALLIAASGKVRDDNDFVCYAQPAHPDGSTTYGSKNNSGGVFSQEVTVNLPAVAAAIEKIKLTLTIDPDTPATFAAVKGCEVVVYEDKGGTRTEVARMKPEGTTENAFIVAELYRYQGAWKLRHVAQGFNNGLAGIATAFGVDVGDEPAAAKAAPPSPPPASTPPPAPAINLKKPDPVGKVNLAKGKKINISKGAVITATGTWQNKMFKRLDYDLYCHVAYKDGTRETVNFDNLRSRNGAVQHAGDLRSGGSGTIERITVRMTDDIACVGFSFYSARENGAGSFADAKAQVSLDNGEGSTITIAVSQMSVDSNRYTLYFGTVINKGEFDVDVVAHEEYSGRDSENQPLLSKDGTVQMDRGPENRWK